MLNKVRMLLLIAGVMFAIAACKPRKVETTVNPSAMDDSVLVGKMKAAGTQFDWMSARFNVQYTGIDKKQLSLGGFLRVRDDSAIWISLSPVIGFEAARAVISHDSVKMVNRLNSSFFLGGIDYINNLLQTDLDYDILQALLCGNDVPYYEDDVFKSNISGNLHHISTQGRRKLKKHVRNDQELERVLIQDIYLDPATFRIRHQVIKQVGQESRKLEVTYDDFVGIEGQLFPHSINCMITVDGNLSIRIKFSRISIGGPLGMPFSIPASYTEVE